MNTCNIRKGIVAEHKSAFGASSSLPRAPAKVRSKTDLPTLEPDPFRLKRHPVCEAGGGELRRCLALRRRPRPEAGPVRQRRKQKRRRYCHESDSKIAAIMDDNVG